MDNTMKSVAFHNLGCKVNGYEMDYMQQNLQERGYIVVPFDTKADIYIINTCSVTNMADRKSRQMIHRAKKMNPDAVVVAVGCYVQTSTEEALKDLSIDIAIGNNRKKDLVEIIEEYLRRSEQEEDFRPRDKKSIAIMAGIFAAALVLVFLLFKLILGDFGPAGNNKSYEVPDVRGRTVGEAQLMDGVKDVFEIVVKGTQRSDTYEAGQIIQQSPEAGRSRKSNFVIEVYVAAEEVKVDMPNVTGKEYRQARIELQELKLDLQFEFLSQNSDSYAKDTVISTAPAAGEALKQGQKVTLYVSTGPKTVTVPTFLGQDIAMAIKTAQDMGLTVGQPLFDPFSSVETGRVTEQSIEPQQVVDGGTQIVFTVSGSGEEDIITRTKAVEFSLPSDMDGMIKVEYEQDGEIIDSQYISSNLQTVSYTFTGQVGAHSLVRAYFTCINDNSVASSPTQEISF